MDDDRVEEDWVRSFDAALAGLIRAIRAAIEHHRSAAAPAAPDALPWAGPQPWQTRALPNLEKCHEGLRQAWRSFRTGDIKPVTIMAAGLTGLSKDIEFGMDWMTDADREQVARAIGLVAGCADRIHRCGHRILKAQGRL